MWLLCSVSNKHSPYHLIFLAIVLLISFQPGASLPISRLYNLSVPEKETMQNYGLIHSSTSPVGTGFLFMVKKDKTLWPSIDYRSLNQITIKSKYPVPPNILFMSSSIQPPCLLNSVYRTLTTWSEFEEVSARLILGYPSVTLNIWPCLLIRLMSPLLFRLSCTMLSETSLMILFLFTLMRFWFTLRIHSNTLLMSEQFSSVSLKTSLLLKQKNVSYMLHMWLF